MTLADRHLPGDIFATLRDLTRRLRALEVRPDPSPQPVPVHRADSEVVYVEGASYAAVYRAPRALVLQPQLNVYVRVVTAPAATGDVRVWMAGVYATPIHVTGGTDEVLEFHWTHPAEIGDTTDIVVEARHTDGLSMAVFAPTIILTQRS